MCGEDIEDVYHLMYECKLYEEEHKNYQGEGGNPDRSTYLNKFNELTPERCKQLYLLLLSILGKRQKILDDGAVPTFTY